MYAWHDSRIVDDGFDMDLAYEINEVIFIKEA